MSDPTNKTLFLGDVSSFYTEAELKELFSEYGQVTEVKISGTSRGFSLCYGFVTMAERSQAEVAMEKLQGVVLRGRAIRINWAARNVRDNNSYSSANDMINSIHVRYRTLQRMATPFTEENLMLVFGRYGKVVDSSIKNSFIDQHNGIQRGYGFVHFEKTVEGMKAAVLAAQNETGDSTVTLECEVSKNFIKCSTYLSESGNLSKVEPTPIAGPALAPPIKTCTSQDDNQPEMYYAPPMMRWTTCNGEQINEQVSGQENAYYTNPIRSLDSSPMMCYVHPSTMHPIYVDTWKPNDHRVVAQHQGSYQTLMTGEYIAAETQVPMCQQMAYPYLEQHQQQWAYVQVNNNHVVTEVTTRANNSGATSPSLSCDQAPSGCSVNVLEERTVLNQAECISYGDGTTMDQGSPQPTQVQAHLTRTYPPYQGQPIHPIQMQPVMQQKQHFVYQSLSMSSSPQMTARVFYPAQASTATRQFDDGQLCFSPDVPQTVFYHEPAYQQHVYSSPVPFQIQSNMSMTYPPSPIPQQTQYSTPFMSIVENHVSHDYDQVRRQPFRKKATATLQRFKALV